MRAYIYFRVYKMKKFRDIYIDCHCVTTERVCFCDAEKRFDTKEILDVISKQVRINDIYLVRHLTQAEENCTVVVSLLYSLIPSQKKNKTESLDCKTIL